ncbi:MAG: pantoate--beta-alanine ligase [Flavobacterium sp.]
MSLFYSQKELKEALISHQKSIGFVPTMGALHNGHLALVKESLSKNKTTVVSIFVNPTQFNNASDLEKYPRTLIDDVNKLMNCSPEIMIYAPTVLDIYEGKVDVEKFNFDGLEDEMEGKFRPGHFDGVGTIVKKLFEIVQPSHAYFGEKDFQQLQIVKKLVKKQQLPVEIIGCPIYREPNGLAMSSRNERLLKETREKASIIYKTLQEVQVFFGTKNVGELYEYVKNVFEQESIFELEYFTIAEETTLKELENYNNECKYRAFIAVFTNNIRLIDNISLN